MRAVAVGPALIRVVMLGAAVVLLLVPDRPNIIATVILVAGLGGALARPDVAGAGPVTAGFVIVWIGATGWHGDPSFARTAVAVAALYVWQAATALAAVIPLEARLEPGVLRRFALRSSVVLAVTALVVVVDYALDSRRGSPGLELVGLLAALALVAVPVGRVLGRSV